MAACIFCGKSPTTDAHIFRKAWIDDVMPLAHRYRHRRGGDDSPKPQEGDWITDAIDLKVNSACQTCNGGWMHQLDRAAEDAFLTHVVTGYDVKLPLMEQKTMLARWCALIATLFDQTLNPPTHPKRVHQTIRTGHVPEDMQAWVFRTRPPDDREVAWGGNRHLTVIAQMRSSGLIHHHDVCITTFCIKALVVQVLQPTAVTPGKERLQRSGGDGFARQIWPPPLTPLFWPPPETLGWEQARELPEHLERQVMTPHAPLQ